LQAEGEEFLTTPFPILELRGTAYEQGRQHGEMLRKEIGENLTLYFNRFAAETRLSSDEVRRRAAAYAEVLPAIHAHYAAGVRGIADGSGWDYLDIVALNVRYEIFYAQLSANALADGCTAVALHPSITNNNHLYLAQNWDWFPGTRAALLRVNGARGWEQLAFTEAGIFGGKIGLNRYGVGLAINGLNSAADDWSRLRMPFHVRCYEILRRHTFVDALALVQNGDHACAANFLIAQAPDRIMNVETAPDLYHVLVCQEGCLVHTNHFIDPATAGVVEPPEGRIQTQQRYARMQMLLEGKRPLSRADLQVFFADHDGYPHAICRHVDPQEPAETQYETIASIVMDLTTRSMSIAFGPPCQSNYLLV
jgi:isopenicillin-N N-acyltransferase-like protein